MRLPTETPLYHYDAFHGLALGPENRDDDAAFEEAAKQTEQLVKDLSKGQLRVLLKRHHAALYRSLRENGIKHYDAEAEITVDWVTKLIEDELLEREADGDPPRI